MYLRTALAFAGTLVLSGCSFVVPANYWFHPGAADLPPDVRAKPDLPAGYTLRSVPFAGTDGVRLQALFVSNPSSIATVLYFGGDHFRVGTGGLPVARFFASLHLDCLLVDYRGYGQSEGVPTLSAVKSDAIQAFDVASGLVTRPAQLIVHGFSMGSFVAASLTESRPVRALVLESTAPSATAWAHHQIPWYEKPFVRVRLADPLPAESNEIRVRRYQGYLLLFTGSSDRITPPSMAEALFSIAGSPVGRKRLFVVPGATHGSALQGARTATEYAGFVSLSQGNTQ